MILLLPHHSKWVWLRCGCRRTQVDADDTGTFQRHCRTCKRWTTITVRPSPSGTRVEVFIHPHTVQVPLLDGAGPVEPAAPLVETFPGTGRRGRGGNLAPVGNTSHHKGDAA